MKKINIEFASVFASEMKEFVEFKRGLGFKYDSGQKELLRIDRHIRELGVAEKAITKEVCDKLCARKSSQTFKTQTSRISVVKDFCRYLVSLGYSAYIPPISQIGKDPRFVPHIYTDDELRKLFKAVDTIRFPNNAASPYRAIMMPVFFRILYTSGLRVSELRLARVKEINLEKGIITVRQAKNRKDRLVPIHQKLIGRCNLILKEAHANSNPDDYFFYNSQPSSPISHECIRYRFKRCLMKAGICTDVGEGPRVHDLRHTFCVNLLRKWTAEGKDLMAWLPYMRTILGHETFRETAYYLRLTHQMFPEIGEKLSRKFPDMFKEITDNDEPEFY